jgi:hypothetical protein
MEGFWLYFKKMLNVIIFIAQVRVLYPVGTHALFGDTGVKRYMYVALLLLFYLFTRVYSFKLIVITVVVFVLFFGLGCGGRFKFIRPIRRVTNRGDRASLTFYHVFRRWSRFLWRSMCV